MRVFWALLSLSLALQGEWVCQRVLERALRLARHAASAGLLAVGDPKGDITGKSEVGTDALSVLD